MKQSLVISEGGVPIRGEFIPGPDVDVAALFLIASILTKSSSKIERIPEGALLDRLLNLLEFIGVEVSVDNALVTQSKQLKSKAVPFSLSTDTDLSWLVTTAILARTGIGGIEVETFGKVDQLKLRTYIAHLKSFGFEIALEGKYTLIKAPYDWANLVSSAYDARGLNSTEICGLLFLLSTHHKSVTVIQNPVINKMVINLINYLSLLGAEIVIKDGSIDITKGITDQELVVTVPPSISETVFMIALTIITKGEIIIPELEKEQVLSLLNLFNKMKVNYKFSDDTLRVWNENNADLVPFRVRSESFPGFLADWLELFAVIAATIDGESVLENRTDLFLPSYTESLKDANIESRKNLNDDDDISEMFNLNKLGGELDPAQLQLTISVFGPTKFEVGMMDLSNYDNLLAPMLIMLSQTSKGEVVNGQLFIDRFPTLLKTLERFGYKIKVAEIP